MVSDLKERKGKGKGKTPTRIKIVLDPGAGLLHSVLHLHHLEGLAHGEHQVRDPGLEALGNGEVGVVQGHREDLDAALLGDLEGAVLEGPELGGIIKAGALAETKGREHEMKEEKKRGKKEGKKGKKGYLRGRRQWSCPA